MVDLIVAQSLARRPEQRQFRAVDWYRWVSIPRDHACHRRRGKHRAHSFLFVRCDIRSHQHHAFAVDRLCVIHHLRNRFRRTADDRNAFIPCRRRTLYRSFQVQMYALFGTVTHHYAHVFLAAQRRKCAFIVRIRALFLAYRHCLHRTRTVGKEEFEQRAHAIHTARILAEYALSLFVGGDKRHFIRLSLCRNCRRADRLRRCARAHHARCVIGRIHARPLMDHVIHILSPCLSIQNR